MEAEPTDRTRLILTIQRQTETLDKLHLSLRECKEKLARSQQAAKALEEENGRLSGLQVENAEFRRELGHLQGMALEFQKKQQELISREAKSLEEQQLAHQVESRAHQEHIANLTSETASLRHALQEKDERIAILVDKITIEGSSDIDLKLQAEQTRDKMDELQMELKTRVEQFRGLQTQLETFRLNLESANEEIAQKDVMVQALEKENRAFKNNINQLIQQQHGPRLGSRAASRGPSHHPPDVHKIYDPLFAEAAADTAKIEVQASRPPDLAPRVLANTTNPEIMAKLENYRQRQRRV
eukprot:TRINITY_DN22539_c0_g1_i1.p1 TRINITY_DN22539_c0_g1~~TRINITY_DN22539_c0_g1_i1.p1  ORF type:complete len:299 (+),score=54.82 TRINITY_DN22539_c0_g1_i1:442-1338(+)